ncbi:DNA-3-methyladenine glycosylase I [Fusibacter bizertensis]|uniref:DNA-3-methyladenine glycosylase I n=1 Tax=Fusibacter bizertensis TaxID=1488331 RepID=A0ABT6NAB5_9FIRM|nr:DNA-3-methyladenine glycosylase I [Fusibacter bizertensis]MDH8677355.1 DNA-3-methyladenine glycosylase I [Fusibacter bizertensis]
MKPKERCGWLNLNNELYVSYHDHEWGVPVHDDQKLFEMLILEGAQAGLSWETILKKRDNYRDAFDRFDVDKVALYDDEKIASLLLDEGIVRNRLKVTSAVTNARIFKMIQDEYGSFDRYLWGFVNNTPVVNKFEVLSEVPAKTELSDQISKDLKKRGMKFVGSTIIYAYMQAIGMVNDHTLNCFRHEEVKL